MLITRKTAILKKLAKASADSPPDVPNWRKLRAKKMSDASFPGDLRVSGVKFLPQS